MKTALAWLVLAGCAGERTTSVEASSARPSAAEGRADATSVPAALSAMPDNSASATLPAVAPVGSNAAPTLSTATSSPEPAGAPPPPCPSEMALVGRTCVDRYEAHLVVPTEAGAFERHPHFQRPPEGKPFEARSEAGVFPQAYISRNESQAACFAAAKRLCTFDEWRRACRGPRRQTFPFGMRDRKSACNSSKPHLLPQLFGGDTRTWKYDENFNSPLLNQKEGYLAKSGSFEECRTEEGTYDLVGNLHEWVSGIVTESLVEKLETDTVERRKQPWHVGNGIFVGGFYSTSAEHGPGCLNITIAHEPRYHDYSTGFRCCKAAILPELEPKKPKTKAKKADAPASPSVTAAPSLAPKKKPAAKKKPKAASAPAPTPPAP